MYCLKCGRETEGQNCFCPDCLAEGEKYPVSPRTSVYIPPQPVPAPVKKSYRTPKPKTPEQKIHQLQSGLRVMVSLFLVVLVCFGIVTGLMIHFLNQRDRAPIGANFATTPSVSETSEP